MECSGSSSVGIEESPNTKLLPGSEARASAVGCFLISPLNHGDRPDQSVELLLEHYEQRELQAPGVFLSSGEHGLLGGLTPASKGL